MCKHSTVCRLIAVWGANRQNVSMPICSSDGRLNSDPVVYGVSLTLFAPQILFRRLDRDVTQKELDLFQFATCKMAQTCARAAAPMRIPLPAAILQDYNGANSQGAFRSGAMTDGPGGPSP